MEQVLFREYLLHDLFWFICQFQTYRLSSGCMFHPDLICNLGNRCDLECLGTSVPRSRLHCDVGMLHQTVLRYLQGNYLCTSANLVLWYKPPWYGSLQGLLYGQRNSTHLLLSCSIHSCGHSPDHSWSARCLHWCPDQLALVYGTLDVEKLTEYSKRLPLINEELEEKTMRWLELSEIEG